MARNGMKLGRILEPAIFALVIALAICGWHAVPAAAQEAGATPAADATAQPSQAETARVTLRGTVHTSRGAAIPGATVQIRHVASGKGWETLTDENGQFSVPDLPPGRYHIEAQQLGVGTGAWDEDVKAVSGEQSSEPGPIDLVLRRKSSVQQPTSAEAKPAETEDGAVSPQGQEAPSTEANSVDTTAAPKKHHHGKEAADASGAAAGADSNGVEPNPNSSSSRDNANSNASEAKPVKASAAAQKAPKSKKGGFEQVEPDAILTANADIADQTASTPDAGTTTNQSSGAYLISGAVGRGSTAVGLDGTGQDDSASADDGSTDSITGKPKRVKHQSSGSRSHKSKSQTDPASQDNLSGGVADLTVRDTIKHLGSNQLHATFYNYYDSSAWDARPFAITGGPRSKVAYFGERFGANFGGPLTIPKIYNGKNRTFWFANYELNRHTTPVNLFANMPTAQERAGDFCDRPGIQLYDPQTNLNGPRNLFPAATTTINGTSVNEPAGCVVPGSRIDNAARQLVDRMPLPNLPGFNNNYIRSARNPQSLDLVNARVLHTISPRFSVSGVFNLVSSRGNVLTRFPSLTGNSDSRDQNIMLTFTQNWSPRFINEMRFNFNRARNQVLSADAFTNDLNSQLGITGVSPLPIDFGAPNLTFANFSEFADPGPLLVRNQTVRFMDNVSYTFQKHTLRFGAEFRRRELNTYADPSGRGIFDFSGIMTSQLDASGNSDAATGLDFADFLLGLPDTTEVQFGTSSNYGRQGQLATYIQDDWRVNPRFSVNFGVRYEIFTPFVEKYNRLASLVINPAITQVSVALPGQTNAIAGGLPDSIIHPHYNNVAPRLGIAWRPLNQGGPVVRAGFGMFYNGAILDQVYMKMLNQPPWAQARSIVTSASQLLTLENGYPPAASNSLTNTVGVDPNYKLGYAQIWNASLEQQFGNQYVVEILYTGTKGTHLDLLSDPNQPLVGGVIGSDQNRRIPTVPGFVYESSGADSIYHGMQVRVQRRMSNGLRLLFLYTLGHSIDDASSIGVGSTNGLMEDAFNIRAERGNSFFDIRNDIRSSFGYDLPFGDRRRWLRTGFGAKILGNWELIGTTVYTSGDHLTPYITSQIADGVGPLLSQRPDQIGNPNLPASQQTTTQFFNVGAFRFPTTGPFGNAARGSIVGPAFLNLNMALERRMHFGPDDKYTLQIRWEAQNFTNTTNFSNVITVVDASDAGLVTGAKPMRTMDLFMRLHF